MTEGGCREMTEEMRMSHQIQVNTRQLMNQGVQRLVMRSSTDIEVLAKFHAINEPSMDVDVASSVTLNGDGEEICDEVNAENPKYLQWPWSTKYSNSDESDEESPQPEPVKRRSK